MSKTVIHISKAFPDEKERTSATTSIINPNRHYNILDDIQVIDIQSKYCCLSFSLILLNKIIIKIKLIKINKMNTIVLMIKNICDLSPIL